MNRPQTDRVEFEDDAFSALIAFQLVAGDSIELGNGCSYERPGRLPYWSVSGTWDGDDLLLVDAAVSEVIRYGDDGRSLGTVTGPESHALGPLRPSQIVSATNGMVLKVTEGRLVLLDGNRAVSAQWDIFRESQGESGRIAAMRQWALAGDRVLLCGDVERKGDWSLGYVRAPLAHLERFQVLEGGAFDGPDDPAEKFCRLGYPQIANLADTAYFLVMRETPQVYVLPAGDGPPRLLPDTDFPPRPDLPPLVTSQDFPTVFRAVEGARLVSGLLASAGRLYALMREPRVEGTRWTLHELDPDTGAELGSAIIPSFANHLLVIPGERYWAFVEKGPVSGIGVQNVKGVVRVPASNLEATRQGTGLCESHSVAQGVAIAYR